MRTEANLNAGTAVHFLCLDCVGDYVADGPKPLSVEVCSYGCGCSLRCFLLLTLLAHWCGLYGLTRTVIGKPALSALHTGTQPRAGFDVVVFPFPSNVYCNRYRLAPSPPSMYFNALAAVGTHSFV